MITALTSFSDFLPTVKPTHLFIRCMASSEKILALILPFFKSGSALFFFGYATKELCLDKALNLNNGLATRVNHCRELAWSPTTSSLLRNYSIAHGTLFIGTGICSGFEALHQFAFINLGKLYPILAWGGTGLFLLANLVSLQQNIEIYTQATKICPDDTELEKQQASQSLKSAILGIISSLGYIAATSISLLGAPTGLALLIGCVSACFGALKILHDFYYFYLKNLTRSNL